MQNRRNFLRSMTGCAVAVAVPVVADEPVCPYPTWEVPETQKRIMYVVERDECRHNAFCEFVGIDNV